MAALLLCSTNPLGLKLKRLVVASKRRVDADEHAAFLPADAAASRANTVIPRFALSFSPPSRPKSREIFFLSNMYSVLAAIFHEHEVMVGGANLRSLLLATQYPSHPRNVQQQIRCTFYSLQTSLGGAKS